MPYQAAKAIAATFCWHIRWALTPVFGYNFPDICYHPDDPRYGKFLVDPKIVQACTAETNRFKREGAEYKNAYLGESVAADISRLPDRGSRWKPPAYFSRNSEESGYYTGNDHIEGLSVSPQVSPRGSTFLPSRRSVDESISPSSSPRAYSPTSDRTVDRLPHLRQHLLEHGVYLDIRPTSLPPAYNRSILAKRTHSNISSDCSATGGPNVPSSAASSPPSTNDPGSSKLTNSPTTMKVAKVLMQLTEVDQVRSKSKKVRRASRH